MGLKEDLPEIKKVLEETLDEVEEKNKELKRSLIERRGWLKTIKRCKFEHKITKFLIKNKEKLYTAKELEEQIGINAREIATLFSIRSKEWAKDCLFIVDRDPLVYGYVPDCDRECLYPENKKEEDGVLYCTKKCPRIKRISGLSSLLEL